MTDYRCTWEKPGHATASMTETEARAYYAAHRVAGDCAFAMRPGTTTPNDLLGAWIALSTRVEARAGKETPDDRRLVESLRAAWRTWMAGRPYRVPVVEPVAVKAARKTKPAGACPQCGHVSIAA